LPNFEKLPRDRRGYIIPWVVYRDGDDRPHFTINDDQKRFLALTKDLCPICAEKLLRGRWFVGGPQAAFHERGAYIDPPMHGECAHYALTTCPYLAAPNYSKRIDAKTLRSSAVPLLFDSAVIDERPDYFVAVLATGQKLTGAENYITPKRPYLRVEYWRHGRQIENPRWTSEGNIDRSVSRCGKKLSGDRWTIVKA